MKTYIALLRGINVSGQKMIKMELLRKVLQELKYENIRTYIQSGNILLESNETDTKLLEQQIGNKIREHFGFEVPVLVVTPDELKAVVKNNPFEKETMPDDAHPYVAFLSDIPKKEQLEVLGAIDFKGDQFINVGKSLYLIYPNGAGNGKLTNALIEKKLNVTSTARNWKTIAKLIELSDI